MTNTGTRKKLRTIIWLMLSSLTLLLFILTQWISVQYKEEKRRLNEDLYQIFNAVVSELTEEQVEHLIETKPFNQEDGSGKIDIQFSDDSSVDTKKYHSYSNVPRPQTGAKTRLATFDIDPESLKGAAMDSGVSLVVVKKDAESGKASDTQRQLTLATGQEGRAYFIDIDAGDVQTDRLAVLMDSLRRSVAAGQRADTTITYEDRPLKHHHSRVRMGSDATVNVMATDTSLNALNTGINPVDTTSLRAVKEVLKVVLLQIGRSTQEMPITIDSLEMLRKFTDTVHQRYPSAQVSITRDKRADEWFVYTTDIIEKSTFEVSNYSRYLFRSIMPQVGFSIMLLVLTVISLGLAYRSLKQQYAFNAQKDSFISNISHELKTPVATTKAALEALIDYNVINDPEVAKRYLKMAGWEMNRLEAMIGKVMNILRYEHEALKLEKENTDLGLLCLEVLEALKPLLDQKKIRVVWRSYTENVTVSADKIHLMSAIYNLVENAVKYGGNTLFLTITRETPCALLKVEDNGMGIPEAFREKIFEKFFRIQEGDTHDVKGYGLGLSYARQIVSAHGGTLSLEKGPATGAVFVIRLNEIL